MGVPDNDKPAAAPQMDNRMVCDELVLEPETSRAYWNDVDLALTQGIERCPAIASASGSPAGLEASTISETWPRPATSRPARC